jgi:hypothetical protein
MDCKLFIYRGLKRFFEAYSILRKITGFRSFRGPLGIILSINLPAFKMPVLGFRIRNEGIAINDFKAGFKRLVKIGLLNIFAEQKILLNKKL